MICSSEKRFFTSNLLALGIGLQIALLLKAGGASPRLLGPGAPPNNLICLPDLLISIGLIDASSMKARFIGRGLVNRVLGHVGGDEPSHPLATPQIAFGPIPVAMAHRSRRRPSAVRLEALTSPPRPLSQDYPAVGGFPQPLPF